MLILMVIAAIIVTVISLPYSKNEKSYDSKGSSGKKGQETNAQKKQNE